MYKILFVLVFSLVTALSSCAQTNQTIGVVENGEYKIVCNTEEIKKLWEEMLIKQKTPAILVDFKIVAGKSEPKGETFYMLLATNKDKSVKTARQLILQGNSFVFSNQKAKDDSVTCSGCQDGCDPVLKSNGHWKCSACAEGTSTKNCSKTVTVSVPGIQGQ